LGRNESQATTTFVCLIFESLFLTNLSLYGDTSANEDNSFRNHTR